MARKARSKSVTGVYHVLITGMPNKELFKDYKDKIMFLDGIRKAKEKSQFQLFGYCLLDNHIHMIIKESENIDTIMKRIMISFAKAFNEKYNTNGKVFFDRFKSQPIEKENELIKTVRFIHQNPVKHKLIMDFKKYYWSSYNTYIRIEKDGITDVELVRSCFYNLDDLKEFMSDTIIEDKYLEYAIMTNYSDEELYFVIRKMLKIDDLSTCSKQDRNQIIRELYTETGCSIRQLSRVVNVSKSIIERAVRKEK